MCAAALGQLGERSYANPLTITYAPEQPAIADRVHPDPYVMKFAGEYYCYSTGHDGVTVLQSGDLASWESKGYALAETDKSYWAPCVVYRNGLFYMYYSSGLTPESFQWMKVAVAEHPLGPFKTVKTLFDYFSIDAHVVEDDDGEWYLFYSVDGHSGAAPDRPGTVILVDRLLDPLTLAGEPKFVVGPTIGEEISSPNRFGDGRDWHTLEGAFYLRRGDVRYLMYSGNSFEHERYYVGYATDKRAETISKCSWTKWPNDHAYAPLLSKSDTVSGTGHHSVVTGPNLADRWMMYHGRDQHPEALARQGEQRQLRMDPLLWLGDTMTVPGPTDTPQDAPGLSSFRERFDVTSAGLDQTRWVTEAGNWQSEGGSAVQRNPRGISYAHTTRTWTDFLFEGSAKWVKRMSGGRVGFRFGDAQTSVEAVIDAGRKTFVVSQAVDGIVTELAHLPLGSDFNTSCYHQWNVRKSGSGWDIALDGRTLYRGRLPVRQGSVGMVTHYCEAVFAGIDVTLHYETDFRSPEELEERFSSIAGAVLDQRNGLKLGTYAETSALEYAMPFPAGCTVQLDARFMHRDPAGELVVVLRMAGSDPVVRLSIQADTDSSGGRSARYAFAADEPVEAGVLAAPGHDGVSIRLRRLKGRLQLWVNGTLLGEAQAECPEGDLLTVEAARTICLLTHFSVTEWIS